LQAPPPLVSHTPFSWQSISVVHFGAGAGVGGGVGATGLQEPKIERTGNDAWDCYQHAMKMLHFCCPHINQVVKLDLKHDSAGQFALRQIFLANIQLPIQDWLERSKSRKQGPIERSKQIALMPELLVLTATESNKLTCKHASQQSAGVETCRGVTG
jgi:hypothetical protein